MFAKLRNFSSAVCTTRVDLLTPCVISWLEYNASAFKHVLEDEKKHNRKHNIKMKLSLLGHH